MKNLRKIYISYAWNDQDKSNLNDREFIVDRICEDFEKKGYIVYRDKATLIYGSSIDNFIKEISTGDAIILVISDKYLKSEYCMSEAIGILKKGNIRDRIFPIVLEGTRIYDFGDQTELISYWQTKIKSSKKEIKKILNPSSKIELLKRLKNYEEIERNINEFISIISDTLLLKPEEHINNAFEQIHNKIEHSDSKGIRPDTKQNIPAINQTTIVEGTINKITNIGTVEGDANF